MKESISNKQYSGKKIFAQRRKERNVLIYNNMPRQHIDLQIHGNQSVIITYRTVDKDNSFNEKSVLIREISV